NPINHQQQTTGIKRKASSIENSVDQNIDDGSNQQQQQHHQSTGKQRRLQQQYEDCLHLEINSTNLSHSVTTVNNNNHCLEQQQTNNLVSSNDKLKLDLSASALSLLSSKNYTNPVFCDSNVNNSTFLYNNAHSYANNNHFLFGSTL